MMQARGIKTFTFYRIRTLCASLGNQDRLSIALLQCVTKWVQGHHDIQRMHVSDVSLLPSLAIYLTNLMNITHWHFFWTCSRVQRLLHNQDLQVEDQLDTFQVRTFSSQGPLVCFLRCLCLCSQKLVLSSVSMILESCLACTWFWDRTMNVRYHLSQKCELTWSSAEVSSVLGITFAERGWSNCCYSQLPPAIDAYMKTARK